MGVLVALWLVPAFVIMLIDGAPAHELLWFVVGLVPLLLAALAWQWHLVGGTCIILSTAALFLYVLFEKPYEQWFFVFTVSPFALVFFAGGVLHLVVWWKERRKWRVQGNFIS